MSLLAVLELVRLGRIETQQTELFGEIVIERHDRGLATGQWGQANSCRLQLTSSKRCCSRPIRRWKPSASARCSIWATSARRAALIDELRARYEASSQGLQIVEVGGGYRMVTRPEVAPWLVRLARARTRTRLSRPALETLAIVAYKQPVSRPGDRRGPRRELRGRPRQPARAAARPHRRPEGSAGPSLSLRDDARVPGRVRPAGRRRSAEGRR